MPINATNMKAGPTNLSQGAIILDKESIKVLLSLKSFISVRLYDLVSKSLFL